MKPSTFTFFKFKVPNFKQFLWNTGTGNMSKSYREVKTVIDKAVPKWLKSSERWKELTLAIAKLTVDKK